MAVAFVGLVIADGVIYRQVDSYLGSQVDGQLAAVQPDQLRIDPSSGTITTGPFGATDQVNEAVVEVRTLAGTVADTNLESGHLNVPASVFAQLRRASSSFAGLGSTSVPFSTTASNGKAYRAIAMLVVPRTPIGTVVGSVLVLDVGIPLATLDGTLHRLLLTELLVSAGVLILLFLLGYAVVRIGLRPLEAIEETAAGIAAGDLSRRVEGDNERTEVGRLGRSLNVMLSQIETAFAEQRSTEARLRQFVSDASHELRTPVTSIRGYAELFRRGAASRPEDLASAMRRIEDESKRMGGLVEDLLLLARLDERRPLERGEIDLAEIAADSCSDAQIADPERVIVLDAPVPVIVDGDASRLRQVAANLMQNALRYTPSTATVTVSVRSEGDHAVLSVADEGPGIEPVHAAHIFERFYRGDASRARESGGSGLGLAIVASIAEAHGGTARLESEPGHGARFIVEIPLAPHASSRNEPARDRGELRSPSTGSVVSGPPERDAVIDDRLAEVRAEEPFDGAVPRP